jgi:hypothetical protein
LEPPAPPDAGLSVALQPTAKATQTVIPPNTAADKWWRFRLAHRFRTLVRMAQTPSLCRSVRCVADGGKEALKKLLRTLLSRRTIFFHVFFRTGFLAVEFIRAREKTPRSSGAQLGKRWEGTAWPGAGLRYRALADRESTEMESRLGLTTRELGCRSVMSYTRA